MSSRLKQVAMNVPIFFQKIFWSVWSFFKRFFAFYSERGTFPKEKRWKARLAKGLKSKKALALCKPNARKTQNFKIPEFQDFIMHPIFNGILKSSNLEIESAQDWKNNHSKFGKSLKPRASAEQPRKRSS